MMNKKIFSLLFAMICASNLRAQQIDRMFKISIQVGQLAYQIPKGYKELDSGLIEACDGVGESSMLYRITNADTSIVIGYSFISAKRPLHKIEEIKLIAESSIDFSKRISKRPLVEFDTAMLKKYNATKGGMYYRDCGLIKGLSKPPVVIYKPNATADDLDNPNIIFTKYNNKKYFLKSLYLVKYRQDEKTIEGIGLVLSYYYAPKYQKNIDKIIDETTQCLQFIN